jgi:hypothetical protein
MTGKKISATKKWINPTRKAKEKEIRKTLFFF